MSNKDNGGPAFPGKRVVRDAAWEASREVFTSGMTLRDYFAAKAMQGRLAIPGAVDFEYDAQFAYKMADAMLAERAK